MIYEYPEKFIVPIIYVKVVKENEIYRNKKYKSSDKNKLLILDEELQEDEKIKDKLNIYEDFHNKGTNIFNMKLELFENFLQEPINEFNIMENNLDSEYINGILSEIDNDYANNEILSS
jgi:hypothetical protein